jgi:hypothetical protein
MKHSRFVLIWMLCGIALLWAAAVPGSAQEGDVTFEATPTLRNSLNAPPPPLIAGGPAPDLELLYSSEVRGFYQPCG